MRHKCPLARPCSLDRPNRRRCSTYKSARSETSELRGPRFAIPASRGENPLTYELQSKPNFFKYYDASSPHLDGPVEASREQDPRRVRHRAADGARDRRAVLRAAARVGRATLRARRPRADTTDTFFPPLGCPTCCRPALQRAVGT